MDGILNIDKPAGMSSRQVVDEIIRLSGQPKARERRPRRPHPLKAGHTGTLDPFATGVLVLCLGKATRLAQYISRLPKTYIAALHLGATSDTLDKTGKIQEAKVAEPPEKEKVAQVLQDFVGEIEQTPPAYSAVRVSGMRLYQLARRNEPAAPIKPRRVLIYSIKILEYNFPLLTIEVSVSRGTYIRALARDVGERLATAAYLEELRRTRVGHFRIEDAVSLDNFFAVDSGRQTADFITNNLLPMEMAVKDLTKITVGGEEIKKISLGQAIPLPDALGGLHPALRPETQGRGKDAQHPKGGLPPSDARTHDIAALNQEGKLVAIMTALGGLGKPDKTSTVLKPKKVFV